MEKISISYLTDNKYKDDFIHFISRNYLKNEKLSAVEVNNAVVLPLKKVIGGPLIGVGGVIDEEGNYIEESAQIGKGDTLPRFYGKYEYDKALERYKDETVIYIGAFPDHWGHFLVDMVYRFWYLSDCTENYKVVYCSEKSEIDGVYAEFLELLGVTKERLCRITIPTRYSKVIIPEQGYMACDYYTREYRNTFRTVVEKAESPGVIPYDKIYLSRGHFADAQGKEIGEKSIEENFLLNGFQIIYMEEMTLQKQIFYLNHAQKIAALSGTLCHNIVFANPDAELIILNKTHIINTHQVLINQMMNIKVYYVDVYKEPFRRFPVSYGGGPFWLSSGRLQKFFADQNMILKKENLMAEIFNGIAYVKMCIKVAIYNDYTKLYYRVCKYPVMIGILRKVKQICTGRA